MYNFSNLVNKFFMKKKEYIEKVENLILNKLKYHAPKINDTEIDYKLLDAVGVDIKYPIFILKKPLDKYLYKAFVNVKKNEMFNLILFDRGKINQKKIDKMPLTYQFIKDEIGSSLHYNLDALNINYLSHSDFKLNIEEEFFKINGQKINFNYIPYYNEKKINNNGVIYHLINFLLSGKNYYVNISNTKKCGQKASFELNIPLPRGYYHFKKENNFVEITNLTTKEKMYFNFHLNNYKLSFSNLNGIESCTFALINIKAEVDLLPLQNKKIFLSFSPFKFSISNPKEMQYFFELSQKKFNEIFDLKIISHDKQFDALFNNYLPQKIWEKWQKNDIDEESENKWIKLKEEIVFSDKKGVTINTKIKGLKEVRFFKNLGWKRVFIVHNKSSYMFADRIKYFNFTLLTNEIFKKNNEIYLSIAD